MPEQKKHPKNSLERLGVSFGIFSFLLLLLFSVTFPYRSLLATSVWEYFHTEKLATLMDRENPTLAFTIGEYYFNHGSYDITKAEYYYTRAITLDPRYLEAYYQRGRVFFIQGKFPRAFVDMRMVLNIDPEWKRAYYMLGLIHGYSGELDKAVTDFQAFLEWKPNSWAGHNDLVWVYFQQGNYAQAREVASDGLELSPENPWLENSLGVALMDLGNFDEAKIYFERALEHAKQLEPKKWGEAYPGNNPDLYTMGLESMLVSIQKNLDLIAKKTLDSKSKKEKNVL